MVKHRSYDLQRASIAGRTFIFPTEEMTRGGYSAISRVKLF